jgi:hypothetical protein
MTELLQLKFEKGDLVKKLSGAPVNQEAEVIGYTNQGKVKVNFPSSTQRSEQSLEESNLAFFDPPDQDKVVTAIGKIKEQVKLLPENDREVRELPVHLGYLEEDLKNQEKKLLTEANFYYVDKTLRALKKKFSESVKNEIEDNLKIIRQWVRR